MKKLNFKKITFYVVMLAVFLINLQLCNYVYADLGNGFDKNLFNDVTASENTVDSDITNTVEKILSTIITILKIMAVAGVMVTGVKYMYAGANDKAQIKQTLIFIVLGTALVFAVEPIINIVTKLGNSLNTI